jgi:hypothetical protein
MSSRLTAVYVKPLLLLLLLQCLLSTLAAVLPYQSSNRTAVSDFFHLSIALSGCIEVPAVSCRLVTSVVVV